MLIKDEAVLFLGDCNIRQEETPSVCETLGCQEAEYAGVSWNPRENRYDGSLEMKEFKGPGFSFDRVFFSGACFVQTVLLGQRRFLTHSVGFCLSDHYAVCGFVDLHASYRGGPESMRQSVDRRLALARVRDTFCVRERGVLKDLAQEERLALPARRIKDETARSEKFLAEARAAAKQRQNQRKVLWDSVLGPGSIFTCTGSDALSQAPSASFGLQEDVWPSEVRELDFRNVPGLESMRAERCEVVWRSLSREFYHTVFIRGGDLASVLSQVLLRVPAFAQWFAWHADQKCGQAPECLCCRLWASRTGLSCVSAMEVPSHGVVEALEILLGQLAVAERSQNRFQPWGDPSCPYFAGAATHVDRLTAFVVEERQRCQTCGDVRQSRTGARVLKLGAGFAAQHHTTLSDLFLQWCAPVERPRTWGCRCEGSREGDLVDV